MQETLHLNAEKSLQYEYRSRLFTLQVTGTGSNQMITTIDPKLTEMGLPQYPPLPGNVDPQRIEEIRRTIYVGNLDPTVTPEQVLNFFSQVKHSDCICY